MNLYIMDKEDILKHYKPQTEAENYLVETLRDCYNDLYAIQEVLSDYSLYWENPETLNKELKEAFDHILELEDENKTLVEQYVELKNELAEADLVNVNWSNLFEELKGIKNEQ